MRKGKMVRRSDDEEIELENLGYLFFQSEFKYLLHSRIQVYPEVRYCARYL
jgi:hypothetical protein